MAFLNITGFRDCPLGDLPMLEVLQRTSERVFVPLTVGGGIRGFSAAGQEYSALQVASEYFRRVPGLWVDMGAGCGMGWDVPFDCSK